MLRASLALLLSAAVPAVAAGAEIYRCVENGVPTYQDFPCKAGGSGQIVRLPELQPLPPAANRQDDLEAARKRVDAMARERRQKALAGEIEQIGRAIAQLDRDDAAALEDLRNRRAAAANNVQVDAWERGRLDRALAEEITGVSARNRERTEPLRRRLLELRTEQDALAATPAAPAARP